MIVRKLANFILNKTYFVVGCGQSGEKYNEVQRKICRLQPIDGILNMLLFFRIEKILKYKQHNH